MSLDNLNFGLDAMAAVLKDMSFTGSFTISTINGIDITPGSDTDTDLITVNVTGTPRLWWDEAPGRYQFDTHPVRADDLLAAVSVGTPIVALGNAGSIDSNNSDDNTYLFRGRNNGSGLVTVARVQGAADPHMAFDSQEDGRQVAFDYGGINLTNYKVAKVTKAHDSDLFDAAATTDSATIWTQPANSKLIAAMMRLETQFAGTAWSSLTVSVGLAGDPDGLLVATGNMTSDAADTEYENIGAYYDVFTEGLASKTTAAIAWIAYATSVGGNLNVSTAGTMDFYFIYEEA